MTSIPTCPREESVSSKKTLTPEQQKLVADWFHLAEAAAKKYAKLYHDYDALHSQACLGLCKAAMAWDVNESPAGEKGWGPFAVQRIEWMIMQLFSPRCKESRHSRYCGQQFPEHAEQIYACKTKADDKLEVAEFTQKLLRRLKPIHRAVLIMCQSYGMTQRETATYFNLSRQRVYEILCEAIDKLKRSAAAGHLKEAGRRWGEQNPDRVRHVKGQLMVWRSLNLQKFKEIQQKAAQRSIKSRKITARLSLVLGTIIKTGWYAINEETRTVTGPFRRRAMAQNSTARITRDSGAKLGWPDLGYKSAEVLSVVALNPEKNSRALAEVMKTQQSLIKGTLVKLRRKGLLEVCRKYRNSSDAGWRLTEKALSSRKHPILVVKGNKCKSFLDGGYTPLPATKESSRG